MAALVVATWFIRPFQKILCVTGRKARAVAFGVVSVVEQMALITGFIWLCISLATHLFHGAILQVAGAILFIAVGTLFVLPLASLIGIPLTLILAWPLDLLFPLRPRAKPGQPNADDHIEEGNGPENPGLDEEFLRLLGDESGVDPDDTPVPEQRSTEGDDGDERDGDKR